MKVFLVLSCVFALSVAYPHNFVQRTSEELAKIRAGNPKGNAEENSGQFEGDLVLNNDQLLAALGVTSRNGLINTRYRWANNTVPYTLTEGAFTTEQEVAIRVGLDELESRTCIKFVQHTTETDYVQVTGATTGCWSMVGRQGGKQELNLQLYDPGSGCFRHGTIMHEFIHALGFYHMQSSTNRDEYVEIRLENVESGKEHNFNTYSATTITDFGEEYDYESVMHYGPTAFSFNGELTIVTHDEAYQDVIGQRGGLSDSDVARINLMYCLE